MRNSEHFGERSPDYRDPLQRAIKKTRNLFGWLGRQKAAQEPSMDRLMTLLALGTQVAKRHGLINSANGTLVSLGVLGAGVSDRVGEITNDARPGMQTRGSKFDLIH